MFLSKRNVKLILKILSEQKNIVFNSFVCQLGFFGTRGPLKRSFHSLFKLAHSCQKTPIYTRTRQINHYYRFRDKNNSKFGQNLLYANELIGFKKVILVAWL
jgi:hypothetical protein